MRLFCRVTGHKPDRTRVWNDGVDFRAPCIHCGALMLRDERKAWRLFDQGRDGSPKRKLHRHDTSREL